ncbi:MAG: glycosyltransferase family 4 protein [Candidatus Omnitrophota bacterium]
MKKKIIIFSSGFFIYGAERGLVNFVKVVKDKFEVIVVLPNPGPLEKEVREVYPEVSIKIFPLAILKFSLSPFYYFSLTFLLIVNVFYFSFFVIFKKINIVCSNSLLLSFPAAVAKLTGRKNIWFIREFFPYRPLNRIRGWCVEKLSDTVICQSEAIKEELNIRNKVKVIYEPLDKANYTIYDSDIAKKELNIPVGAKVIALISRIHPSKGQYEFIRVVKDVLKKSQNLALVIAGDITVNSLKSRKYKRKIKKLIKKEGLRNIFFLGYINDISKVICAADICVFPFRRPEPFGIAVAEALAFGKQTFFTFKGGLVEVRRIFQRGNKLDMSKIIEVVSNFEYSEKSSLKELFIPQALSFSEYKNKIISLLENNE